MLLPRVAVGVEASVGDRSQRGERLLPGITSNAVSSEAWKDYPLEDRMLTSFSVHRVAHDHWLPYPHFPKVLACRVCLQLITGLVRPMALELAKSIDCHIPR